MASILDQLGVLVKRALLVLERRSHELELSALQLLRALVNDVDDIVVGVDGDGVAVADETDRATLLGLRRDVADEEAVAAAGEAAVGDKRDVLAEAVAHDGRAGLQHLRHAGTALGTLVADDHNRLLALLESASLESLDEEVFSVEAAGLSSEDGALLAGDLANGAFGGEAATENLDVASLLDGVGDRADDVLIGREIGHELGVLLQSLTSDGHAGAIENTLLKKELDQAGRAANFVQVLEDVLAGGLEVSEEGCAVRNGLSTLR